MNDGNGVRVDAGGSQSSVLSSASPDYTNSRWDMITFNGGYAIVANNGKSTPLYMLFGDPVAGATFQPLPNWNYVSGLTVYAKVVRQLGYSLVAANLTLIQGATTTYAPSTIRVSVQAATGAIPNVWQPGLTTDTADEFEINSTSPILDMAELRGNMYVYSSDSIHVLSIKSGSTIAPYARGYGILNTNCVAEFEGKHFVVDRNDIYVHAGSGSIQSIAENRTKDYFFNNLNRAAVEQVFVQRNPRYKEIWIHYPKGTSTTCNEVLIYNYSSDTWTIRTDANVVFGFNGPALISSAYNYAVEELHLITNNRQRILKADSGYNLYNNSNDTFSAMTAYIQRERLNSGDTLSGLHITGIAPLFDSTIGNAAMTITVTAQNNYTTPADFSNASGRDATTIIPNSAEVGYRVDPRVGGRVLNYKISGQAPWRLGIMAFELQPFTKR
jgi:hypothetical protein